MTENTSPSKCMPSSYRDGNRPLYRCDTPSLVASTPEPSNCYGVSSIDLNHFKRDLDFAEQSADLEKKTNSGRSNRLGEEKKSRQFQRWTSFEDQSLEKGVQMGDGPPHDWKKIALDHLAGMRSPRQVRVSTLSVIHFNPPLSYQYHRLFSASQGGRMLFVQILITVHLVPRKTMLFYTTERLDWDGRQLRLIYRAEWPNKSEIALLIISTHLDKPPRGLWKKTNF